MLCGWLIEHRCGGEARAVVSRWSERSLRPDSRGYGAASDIVLRYPKTTLGGHASRRSALTWWLYVSHPEGLLPAGGYRLRDRRRQGRARYFLRCHVRPHQRPGGDRGQATRRSTTSITGSARSRRSARAGCCINLKPFERADGHGRPGAGTPAPQDGSGRRGHDLHAGPIRTSRSAGASRRRSINTRCRMPTSTELVQMGSHSGRRPSTACRSCGTLAPSQKASATSATLEIDRQTAARLGITAQAIDDILYDAFGQRQVATLFTQRQSVSRHRRGRSALSGQHRGAAASLCALLGIGRSSCRSACSAKVERRRLAGARSTTRACFRR